MIEQIFNALLFSIAVYLSVHFYMYNKCCAEVGSRDERQLPVYTSSSPGMGILCVARVAMLSVAVLAAACVVCPAGLSSPSELAGASSPGDLGAWVSPAPAHHRDTGLLPSCSEQGSSGGSALSHQL